ncbi:hypothetical protein BRARA_C04536 [Brassica rapa]|uniref:Uncharacterized protein n=1 Tax=Brassica campestris TaxID=3711 RepID=A0A398ABM1_BRACM|nr:hypothetical protein BRARA_C04536 [Brassica rapa]
MQTSFSLIQTVAISGVFSAVWIMFGRESARKELGGLIEELRRGGPDSSSPPNS